MGGQGGDEGERKGSGTSAATQVKRLKVARSGVRQSQNLRKGRREQTVVQEGQEGTGHLHPPRASRHGRRTGPCDGASRPRSPAAPPPACPCRAAWPAMELVHAPKRQRAAKAAGPGCSPVCCRGGGSQQDARDGPGVVELAPPALVRFPRLRGARPPARAAGFARPARPTCRREPANAPLVPNAGSLYCCLCRYTLRSSV